MALAWPYGITEPHIYAYLAAAASGYGYPVGAGAPSPLTFYPGVGVGLPGGPIGLHPAASLPFPAQTFRPTTASDFLAAAAASARGGGGGLRPAPHSFSMAPLTSLGCALRSPLNTSSLLSPRHQVPPHSPSSIMAPAAAVTSSSLASARGQHPSSPRAHAYSRSKSSSGSIAPNGLFRPFQSEVEKT